MQRFIDLAEAGERLDELVDQVIETGRSFVITRDGAPVAVLSPVEGTSRRDAGKLEAEPMPKKKARGKKKADAAAEDAT